MPAVSIIIVNYKSIHLLQDCLRSMFASREPASFEIIIIDNSNDDPAQLLQQFPAVQWVPMGYNAGFARANNKGIRMAKGDTVLLMNPDMIVEDDTVVKCYERFRTEKHVACGVQLLNPDRSPQVSGSFFMNGGLNHLLPIPFIGNFFKWLGTQLQVKKTSIQEVEGIKEVDWINGAFLMVKKTAIEKAGLLDEDFFLYAEEIEWCSRLRKQGTLCIYGDLHVVHLQGETANEAFGSQGRGYYNMFDRKGRQIMLSNFVRIRKQFGAGWFLVHLLFYTVAIPVFALGVLLQQLSGTKERYHFAQWKGYCKNLLYLWSLSPKVIANKPYFYKAL